MISWIELLGFIAAILTTSAALPQLVKMIKTKKTEDISLSLILVFSSGIFLWGIYGFLINSWPVIIANILTFILWLAMLYYKLKYK